MSPDLCVVLPVRNAEATLAADVASVLEAAGETGTGFEVLIVDNGSRDDTWEVICELARQFPQILAIRSPAPIGLGQIVESARTRTEADWMCVHRGVGAIAADEIVRHWHSHIAGYSGQSARVRSSLPFGFQLLPHAAQTNNTSTPHVTSRIAVAEHLAGKESSRHQRRQALCQAVTSDLIGAK